MKKCNSCTKEIAPEAKRCPYCQDYQKWHYDPFIYIIPLFWLPFFFMSDSFWNKKYEDYKDSFSSEFVNKVDDSKTYAIHTYEIKNSSGLAWKDIRFQLIGYDENDKVIVVESKDERPWTIGPNQSSMLSVELRENSLVKKWQFKITDMRYERF